MAKRYKVPRELRGSGKMFASLKLYRTWDDKEAERESCFSLADMYPVSLSALVKSKRISHHKVSRPVRFSPSKGV